MKCASGLLLLLAVLFSTSCSDSVEVWKEDRDRLLGEWEGTASYSRVYDDGAVETGERFVNIRLASEGIAVLGAATFSNNFEWFYQPDPETILFSQTGPFTISGMPSVIDVIVNNSESQQWETRFSGYDNRDSLWLRYDSEEVWALTRQ